MYCLLRGDARLSYVICLLRSIYEGNIVEIFLVASFSSFFDSHDHCFEIDILTIINYAMTEIDYRRITMQNHSHNI